MNTFIINSWRGVVAQKKKFDVRSKLLGREWRMLSDDPSVSAKYIFLKDGKLLISVNGVSTYSTWQLATESSIILDEGIATFLYKVVHIDDNLIVLNLDGTDNFCFLTNETSVVLPNPLLEDIQWYLYRQCGIDILSQDQKHLVEFEHQKQEEAHRLEIERRNKEREEDEAFERKAGNLMLILALIIFIAFIIMSKFFKLF